MGSNEHGQIVGSPSLDNPDYWWFTVRSKLLAEIMGNKVKPNDFVLDVGSADGPSVDWLKNISEKYYSMDLDPRGLGPNGVVGSVMDMPFGESTFDVVSAFDVIEHCSDEKLAFDEIYRTLKPGGCLLMSVPAYEWAWTSFDMKNAHHRRYTRKRLKRGLENSGFTVERITHGFGGTLPFFAADRIRTRIQERNTPAEALGEGELPPLPTLSPFLENSFKVISKFDQFVLERGDLPFGSSIFVVAVKINRNRVV